MEKSKKQQYTTAVSGVLIGLILLTIWWTTDMPKSASIVILIFKIGSGGAGIISFFSPAVSEILAQIMKNLADNQEREQIHHLQHKPVNSPQTGTVQGNVNNYYGNQEGSKSKKKETNKVKIKKRLNEIKSELEKLKTVSFREGSSDKSALKKEVKGIIHNLYSENPTEHEKRLIHKPVFIYSSSSGDAEFQRDYLEDVKELISTINVILREIEY